MTTANTTQLACTSVTTRFKVLSRGFFGLVLYRIDWQVGTTQVSLRCLATRNRATISLTAHRGLYEQAKS